MTVRRQCDAVIKECMMNQDTRKAREAIGFPNRKELWSGAEAVYSEQALRILGQPVMEAWENGYMRELAKVACSGGGKVLEVGFGMGISATHVQSHSVEMHYVVEANASVYSRLEEFAKLATSPVVPLFGFWEDVVSQLQSEMFSGILFDTYPLQAGEMHSNHYPFFKEAYRLLKKGGVLTYYSDEVAEYSPPHLVALSEAGFTNLARVVCSVNPPEDCLYWKQSSLMVPIVKKDGVD